MKTVPSTIVLSRSPGLRLTHIWRLSRGLRLAVRTARSLHWQVRGAPSRVEPGPAGWLLRIWHRMTRRCDSRRPSLSWMALEAVGAGLFVSAVVLVSGAAHAISSTSAEAGVCGRSEEARDAIVSASGVGGCADVEERHLRDIVSLDLSARAIASLSVGDFGGLGAVRTLDLSSNDLTALPAGLFDELFSLQLRRRGCRSSAQRPQRGAHRRRRRRPARGPGRHRDVDRIGRRPRRGRHLDLWVDPDRRRHRHTV